MGSNWYVENHVLYTFKELNGEGNGFNLLLMVKIANSNRYIWVLG